MDDPELREMSCDPKFRKALVTDGTSSATAWVDILSIHALANHAPHGTYSAVPGSSPFALVLEGGNHG